MPWTTVCTHDGGPLGEGFLEGFTIACPRHGAKFDIRDGRVLCMPAASGTPSHEVKVEGDEVFVKIVERPKKRRGITYAATRVRRWQWTHVGSSMPIQEETVYAALKQVRDPELMVNVVDLGLIYGVAVEDAGEKTNLGVMMTMTTPACPYGPQLVADVRDALMALDGAGEVKVEVTLTPPWSPEMMTEAARDELGMF